VLFPKSTTCYSLGVLYKCTNNSLDIKNDTKLQKHHGRVSS
jgi:hypothetical protein